jgi:hypothetical protein
MTLKSELVWIWLPSFLIVISSRLLRPEQTRHSRFLYNQPS